MTREQFKTVIDVLSAGIRQQFIPQEIEAWYLCLKDLPIDHVRTAVVRWLCENESGFPSIGTIRRFASEAVNGRADACANAWARVLAAVNRCGGIYGEPDKIRAYVGELSWKAIGASSGWRVICDADASQMSVLAGQFRKAYESLAAIASADLSLPAGLRPRIAGDVAGIVDKAVSALPEIPE